MRRILNLFFFFVSASTYHSGYGQVALHDHLSDALFALQHPQDSARTKVWWFHGETETTKAGITADLEAFKKAGVGGVVYYDQSHGKAENALPGFSPKWWEMFRFAAEEAARLKLSFEVHLSNGYVAGGPWITNELSMKRLTATETVITGGKRFNSKLAAPRNGQQFFQDVAVLAFPAYGGRGKTSNDRKFTISSNIPGADFSILFDKDAKSLTRIKPADSNVFITLDFGSSFEARSITYELQPKGKATTSATNVPGPPAESFVGTGYRVLPDPGQLEASEDGIHYYKVCNIKPIYRAHESWKQKTIAFPAVKARYYRLKLHDWWEGKKEDMLMGFVTLNTAAKIDQWEEKAGLFAEYIEEDRTPSYHIIDAIDAGEIINLSSKMDPGGTLDWEVPPGDWVVMRFAYVPTGATIKHGRQNLMGKECDKLSAKAAKVHWENYVGKIIDSLRSSRSGQLSGVAMDSHEAGAQNWTDDFIEQFKQRRGYDPTLFLPVMMGYVVSSVGESDGFLFDIRRNIADLIADNYYGTFNRLANEEGLTFTAQAIGNALCIDGDPIQAKSKVDKPQGEFWAIHPDGNYDIKESSSAAHLYGKRIASAEAYTDAKYSASLAELKSLADYAYAFGINEFVICASAYQPWLDRVPGSTGGGRHYAINRNNSWWNYSRPFWDYQARMAAIMRLGLPSIDLCVYLGENPPVKILTYRLPDIPGGFDFDAFTTDALVTRMDAIDDRIVLPGGQSYQLMILPRNGDITLDALRKIASLVEKGVKLYGSRPKQSGSMKDASNVFEYKALTNKLWGIAGDSSGIHQYGKGATYSGMPLSEAISKAGMVSDIGMKDGNTRERKIYFNHRKLADADIYFLNNHKDTAERNHFTFRNNRRYAQLWNAVTGERYRLELVRNGEFCNTVLLNFAPRESFLVVFTEKEEKLPAVKWPGESRLVRDLGSKWEVVFDKKMGGPGSILMDSLQGWTKSKYTGIKFYSGTAVYKKRVNIDTPVDNLALYLNNLQFVARVFINGREAGIVWASPWQVNISKYLKKGVNEIEIHVANSLVNRMIYDAGLPKAEQVTFSYPSIVAATDPLLPSGLTEVKLIQTTSSPIQAKK